MTTFSSHHHVPRWFGLPVVALLIAVVAFHAADVSASVSSLSSVASSSSSGVRQRSNDPSSATRRSRSLLCLGIFRDCDKDDSNNSTDTSDGNSTDDVGSGAGGININIDDFCLGIFRDCNTSSTNSNNNGNSTTDCDKSDNGRGIFGGRPLFGKCGIITELIYGRDGEGGILNGTDTDGDGDIDSYEFNFGNSNSSDKGPFGLGLLPEGGLLWSIFNRDDDATIIEAVMDVFDQGTDAFSFGFLEEWTDSAMVSNETCVNADTAPACFDAGGSDGFWVCRTLTDPYSGEPSSKTICTGEGSFLENNDECGCCSGTDSTTSNSTTSTPVCPEPCPCACDLDETGDGVWIVTDYNVLNIENATDLIVNKCVDPRWAVSATSGFQRITCLEECPTDGN